VAPLGVAARCELRHLRETAAPVSWVEVESAFLLTLPLVSLPEAIGGACTLAVDTGVSSGRSRLAGVRVEFRDGQVTSCSTRLVENPSTWALGTVESWLNAAIADDSTGLCVGGKRPDLPMGIVAAIHETLTPPALLAVQLEQPRNLRLRAGLRLGDRAVQARYLTGTLRYSNLPLKPATAGCQGNGRQEREAAMAATRCTNPYREETS
jgi:hypothetical protein